MSLEMISESCRQNGLFFRQGGKFVINSDGKSETLNRRTKRWLDGSLAKPLPPARL